MAAYIGIFLQEEIIELCHPMPAHVGQIAHIKRFMAHSGAGISAGKSIVL